MPSAGLDLPQIWPLQGPLLKPPSADPVLRPKSLPKVPLEGPELRLRSLLSALPPKQPSDAPEFRLRLLPKVPSDAPESLLRSRQTALPQRLPCAGQELRLS